MSDTTLPVPVAATAGATPNAMLERVRGFARQPAVAKSLPFVGIAGAILIALLAWTSFAKGPQRDLFAGLSDQDKASVADTLKSSGVAYTLDRDSGTLTVNENDYYRAKMVLAQAGLPKSAPDGDAMISSLPMGASRAVEGERLRGARELDLARTIEQIDAVAAAKVHLAAEQPSVFVRDQAPASASVMLTLRQGRALSDGQVSAIVNLVGSSVPGLSPDNVSVVDQAGHLLSRKGGDSTTDRQIDLQSQTEQRYMDAIAKLLTPLVGADGFTTEVHADLDFAETQATRESFPKDSGVVAAEKGGWENNGANGNPAPGGIPGAIANSPPTAAQVSTMPNQTTTPAVPGATAPATAQAGTTAAAAQGKTSEQYDRTFQLGHEVSVTKNPVGSLKRLSVAVALKQGAKPRGVAEMQQIEQLLKGAVGFDQQRGDQFALSSRAFADAAPELKAKWYEASWTPVAARNGTALIIASLAFFGIARPLLTRKAKADASAAAAPAAIENAPAKAFLGNQIAAALADEAVNNPEKRVTLDMIEAAPGYADRAALIRNFVRQDPDRAALVVRDLIRADMPGGAE
ncbi:flagellar basal-body MS-ring/collar protein FliF [Sphingomonas nostoxanthinifaciens]|uniref:flagellar basal-body MS-ring/collar protein FliF n=1 Tax=Sphingomonas nostoxanthinifaciens TaxID=2872652 RepID=UPI001CC1D8E2|nr:flagellar basal-body MS-ring/collar protein FliF [Sphingomonas nostoxanthinifaciens]UAK26034.1 flagellar M-ring protein FliF [Sphingomonas nostoxanthinifaciens]